MSHHSDFEAWQGPSTDTRIKNLEASNRIMRKAAFEADQRARREWKRGFTVGAIIVIIGVAADRALEASGIISALGVM